MPRDDDSDLGWLSAQLDDDAPANDDTSPEPEAQPEPATAEPAEPAGAAERAVPAVPADVELAVPAERTVPAEPAVRAVPVALTVPVEPVEIPEPAVFPPAAPTPGPAAVPEPVSTRPTLPAPPAPWWTTPLESPWASTATPLSRSEAAQPSSAAEPAAEPEPEPASESVAAPAQTPEPEPVPVPTRESDPESAPRPVTPAVSTSRTPSGTAAPVGHRPVAVQAADAGPVSAVRHTNWRTTPGAGTPRTYSKPLIWSSVAVVLLIVLVSLFFLGQRLVGGSTEADPVPAATATSQPTAEPTPESTPIADVTAMASAGVHPWTALYGGECLEPYESPWAEQFTVVDCATPHTAQVVFRGLFEGGASVAFPGETALAAQIPTLCTATGVINISAAAALADVQVQGSYPVTAAQWAEGQRHYYCFVSRSSGEPLTMSLAA